MKLNNFHSRYVKWNYASISFHFHARKEETKQSVNRNMRKGEHGVKTENANTFTRKILWTTDMRNIINHDEQCIELLRFMLPVGKSKNYCRSYEFRQIICPLNKHSQNKILVKIFKIQAFEIDINNNSISCNYYVKN